MEGSKSGDSLVFHYSGHGTQEVNMDEIDHRYDNAICPVDHEHKGKILINRGLSLLSFQNTFILKV